MSLVVERFRRMSLREPTSPVGARLRLCRGCMADYRALAGHHYRAGRPATVTRVIVVRDVGESVVGRFRGLGAASTQASAGAWGEEGGEGTLVGVLVESMPRLSCVLREVALGGRYGFLPDGERAKVLNEEVRCISRVVVEPRYRGLGVAVRLVKHALATATTPVTEAIAAMGHVSPFFERAGMTAYRRPAHAFDARLGAALNVVGMSLEDLVVMERARRRIEALPGAERDWLLHELRRWYRQTLGRHRGYETDPWVQLRAARERLGMEPVYYVAVREGSGAASTQA